MNYRFDKIAFNSTVKKTPTESDKEHYIGLEHIDSECLEITRWGSDVAPIGEKLIMKKGDVLFGKRRAYQRKLAIAPFDGIFSAHGMVLRPNEEVVDKNYFPFFMSSDLFMERAVQISVGGLSPTINWKDLREQEFPLPSLAEQKVLADKLWAAYRLKESYKKLLAATEEMVKSQFIEMFGLNKEYPKDTAILTMKEVASKLFAGGDKPSDYSDSPNEIYRYPIIANGVGEAGVIGYCKEPRVVEDALTISARGTIGYCAIRKAGFLPVVRLITLVPNNRVLLPYLKFYFENVGFESTGAVQGQLTIPSIKEKKIVVPPLEIQKQFCTIAEQADKSGFELRKSIDAIDAVIKSLINS
jgi:type I restriction enzyme S subunit